MRLLDPALLRGYWKEEMVVTSEATSQQVGHGRPDDEGQQHVRLGERVARRCGAEPPPRNTSPSGDVCAGALEVLGRQVVERRVDALPVVERLDVVEQAGARVAVVAVLLVAHELGLQRVEETLHRRVVVAVALAAHAREQAALGEQAAKRL